MEWGEGGQQGAQEWGEGEEQGGQEGDEDEQGSWEHGEDEEQGAWQLSAGVRACHHMNTQHCLRGIRKHEDSLHL